MKTYKSILYIEDEQQIAEIYAEILCAHGFDVTLAFDGVEGLKQAFEKRYDLILLDLMLPLRSGSEILDILRDKQQSPSFDQSTDIIILTNFEVDDIAKQKMLTKSQGYLIKVNVTPKKLMEYMAELSAKS